MFLEVMVMFVEAELKFLEIMVLFLEALEEVVTIKLLV